MTPEAEAALTALVEWYRDDSCPEVRDGALMQAARAFEASTTPPDPVTGYAIFKRSELSTMTFDVAPEPSDQGGLNPGWEEWQVAVFFRKRIVP